VPVSLPYFHIMLRSTWSRVELLLKTKNGRVSYKTVGATGSRKQDNQRDLGQDSGGLF